MPEGSPHFHTECEQAATEEEDAVGTRPGFALDAAGSQAQWGMPRKTSRPSLEPLPLGPQNLSTESLHPLFQPDKNDKCTKIRSN